MHTWVSDNLDVRHRSFSSVSVFLGGVWSVRRIVLHGQVLSGCAPSLRVLAYLGEVWEMGSVSGE